MSEVKCNKCKHYCRVVNHLNKTVGRVCSMWLEGIVDSDGWYASEKCFEKRDKMTITNEELYELIELIKKKKKGDYESKSN